MPSSPTPRGVSDVPPLSEPKSELKQLDAVSLGLVSEHDTHLEWTIPGLCATIARNRCLQDVKILSSEQYLEPHPKRTLAFLVLQLVDTPGEPLWLRLDGASPGGRGLWFYTWVGKV